MDPTRFDHLTRLLGRAGERRAMLRAFVGAVLGGSVAEAAARKRDKGKDNDRDQDRDKDRARDRQRGRELQAEGRGSKRRKRKKKRRGRKAGGGQPPPPAPAGCCGATSCADPEPGGTHERCAYAGRDFVGADHRGAILRGIDGREARFTATDNRGSVFAYACLHGARFRRAKLEGSTWSGACLFGTDFTGADLGGDSAVFAGALFCNTTMPDGSVNDRDCDRATACCRAELGGGDPCQSAADCADEACRTKACTNGQCVYSVVADGPDPSGECGADSSRHCCEGECCLPGATECDPDGLCCAPNCTGRECGPDGCGDGEGCGRCPPGAACDDDGQCRGTAPCTAQSCPNGCCDANNVCRAGTSDATCGRGGAPCARCQAGQLCCSTPSCGQLQGTCVCSGESCPDGCCESFTNCRPGTSNAACGMDGLECLTCDSTAGEVCAQIGSGEDAKRVCICTPQTCPTGCCSGGPGEPGSCFPNRAPTCGINGALCQDCFDNGVCNAQGQCVCTPDCVGKVCGGDGCGGSCGECRLGETCNFATGQCTCTATSCPSGQQCCADDRCGLPNGGVCCQPSDCCSGNCFNNRCAARVSSCGGFDCGFTANGCAGETCCGDPATISCGDDCCGPPATACDPEGGGCVGGCRPNGTACCQDSQCCDGRCCGGTCCPTNQTCCGETCCDTGHPLCCGNTCCLPGQNCCGDTCCPRGRQCCAGVCCDDDSACFGSQCLECAPNCPCFGQSICVDDGLNAQCGEGGPAGPCVCVVSRAGQPFCLGDSVQTDCTTDADCQQHGAGSVCVNAAPAGSVCPTDTTFCAIACSG
jgi:hypothetical protein